MGEYRAEVLAKEAKAAADKAQYEENMRQHERRQQEARVQREREQAEEVARLQALIAAAQAEHALLFDELEAKRAAAEKEMWRWPTGVTIEVYKLQYCQGSYSDEDSDEKAFDYNGGWAGVNFFDEKGCIRIETRTYYYGGSFPRTIHLMQPIADRYHPVWDVCIFSSIEELPQQLQQEIKVTLPHATWDSGYYLDHVNCLKRLEPDEYTEDYAATATATVGKVPLSWIRTLVEQQAQKSLTE